MRVLLITNLFHPEPNFLKGLEFAKELRRRGHDVHVLTGFPNYPGGKVYPGYRMRWTAREVIEGIPVTRVAAYPSHDSSAVRRIASYVSVGLSQAVHALFMRQRFDVCHVYLGPLTLMWPARVLRALTGCRIVADVQDIWPESVTDSGMLRSGLIARVLAAWCRRSYQTADRLIVLSEGYRRALIERGVSADKIDVVYNWSGPRAENEGVVPDGALRPGAFNVVYAGNLGRLQALDTVLDAAKRCAGCTPPIDFIIVGDGIEAERLRRRVADEKLGNVRMLGRFAPGAAAAILGKADVLLIHLASTSLTQIGIPQKVQSYLASGKPILAAVSGDAAELVQRCGAGVVCSPEDPEAMSASVRKLVAMPDEDRAELGRIGRRYYEEELSFDKGVDRIEGVLRRVGGG